MGAHQALADAAGVPRCSPFLAMLPARATFGAAWGWGETGREEARCEPAWTPVSACFNPSPLSPD